MKTNFEISALGVEELTQQEMLNEEGGSMPRWKDGQSFSRYCIELFQWCCSDEGQAYASGYNKGFNDGYYAAHGIAP